MKKVVILGAKGRFGNAAVNAFAEAGWKVRAVARSWASEETSVGIEHVEGDAFDVGSLRLACAGHTMIVNAVNLPYPRWRHDLPKITQNVIQIARENKATVMIPGNVYNYGNELPVILKEKTPHVGNTVKGRLRIEMEQTYREAADDGVRTLILRAGDFIDGRDTGNWFETHIANKVSKGLFTYPGPMDSKHSWAYLPDAAQALVQLAENSDQFEPFEEFGFSGINVTGEEMRQAIATLADRPIRQKSFPWIAVWIGALFSPLLAEVLEMRYLWKRPHEIDDTKLREALPNFEPTKLNTVLKLVLSDQLHPQNKTKSTEVSDQAPRGLAL